MSDMKFENLTICQECSVVFDYELIVKKVGDSWFTKCPVCKHEYQLPSNHNHNESVSE